MDDKSRYRDAFGPIYGSVIDAAPEEPGVSWVRISVWSVAYLLRWVLGAALVVPVAYVLVRGEANAGSLLVAALPLSVFGAFAAFGTGHRVIGWLARLAAVAGFLVVALFALIGLAMYGAAQP